MVQAESVTEKVFEILAEGGSLTIERLRNPDGEKFIYHHNEMDLSNEGLGINKSGEYENFEQPFQLINSKYPWFLLYLSKVHEECRDYVLSELLIALNKNGVTSDGIHNSKEQLEETLNVKLEFGNEPLQWFVRTGNRV
jgi:hypothetical protein